MAAYLIFALVAIGLFAYSAHTLLVALDADAPPRATSPVLLEQKCEASKANFFPGFRRTWVVITASELLIKTQAPPPPFRPRTPNAVEFCYPAATIQQIVWKADEDLVELHATSPSGVLQHWQVKSSDARTLAHSLSQLTGKDAICTS